MTSESLLQIIFQKANQLEIPIVILGGLALPAYNAARTTFDIDIVQIIINNYKEIDWEYLRFRLEWGNVKKDLKKILEGPEATMRDELKDILDKALKQTEC
ncbi:MAG: hypothetical protein R6U96_16385 [Promethearchaeia archaeon]